MRLVLQIRWLSLCMAGVAAFAASASAQNYVSTYTSTAPGACKIVERSMEHGESVVMSCRGQAGLVVRVAEDDLRTSVSVGRTLAAAEKEPAGSQTFGPFNSVGDALEWRSAKDRPPFALIQRWFLADSEAPDRTGKRMTNVALLVVTRLPPGPVCHVAYVDVRANGEKANDLARKAAEERARTFNCRNRPLIIGARGRATQLAAP